MPGSQSMRAMDVSQIGGKTNVPETGGDGVRSSTVGKLRKTEWDQQIDSLWPVEAYFHLYPLHPTPGLFGGLSSLY